jgi:hypothetical protein
MRGRMSAPFRLQGGETRQCEVVERLIPCPAGIGDDMCDQPVEIDSPGASCEESVSDASEGLAARNPAALARAGNASINSPTEKGRSRNASLASPGSTWTIA